MMTSDNRDLRTQLQEAFSFTDADIQANRSGELTSSQQQQLTDNIFPFWKVVGITVLIVFISTLLGTFTVTFSSDPVLDVEYIPIAFAIIIIFAVVFLGLFYRHRRKVYVNLRAGHVTPLEGRLKIIESETGGIGRFQVRKYTFNELTQDQYDVVLHISETHDRQTIIIYHVPDHYKVLSMEFPQEVEDVE